MGHYAALPKYMGTLETWGHYTGLLRHTNIWRHYTGLMRQTDLWDTTGLMIYGTLYRSYETY